MPPVFRFCRCAGVGRHHPAVRRRLAERHAAGRGRLAGETGVFALGPAIGRSEEDRRGSTHVTMDEPHPRREMARPRKASRSSSSATCKQGS
eukprot:scaffold48187_cov62-Phaeocystis_antarctica.AAC.5